MNKSALLDTVLENMRRMAARAEEARRQAQEEANAHLGRLVSRYDTFKEEAQYLEAAQQQRASEIAAWIHELEQWRSLHPEMLEPACTVRAGAVVTVLASADPSPQHFFLLPAAAGETLRDDSRTIQTLSLRAPLARCLHGRRAGERVSVRHGSEVSHVSVLEVA